MHGRGNNSVLFFDTTRAVNDAVHDRHNQKSESDHIIIEIGPETDGHPDSQLESAPTNCMPLTPGFKLKALFYLVPFINAAVEAVQTDYGVQDKPIAMRAVLGTTAFMTGMGIGSKFTVHSMKDTYKYLRSGKKPKEWKELSGRRQYAALAMAVGITGYVAFSDAAQSFYFVKQMPGEYQFDNYVSSAGWQIPCWIIAGTTAIGFIFSEGMETYKAAGELLSSEQYQYTNETSRYISQISMAGLGYFGAVNDVLVSYMGIKEVFNLNSAPNVCIVGSLSFLNGVTDYSMNARFIRDSVDQTIQYVTKNSITKKDVIAFILSVIPSGILAYAGQEFLESFWKMALKELMVDNDPIVIPLVSIMSWGGAAHYFSTSVPSLYPLIYKAVDYMDNKLCSIKQNPSVLEPVKVEEVTEDESKPLLSKAEPDETNQHLRKYSIYGRDKSNHPTDKEIASKRCQFGCNIL